MSIINVIHSFCIPDIPDTVELLPLLSHPSLLDHPPISVIFLMLFLLYVLDDIAVIKPTKHYLLLLSFSVVDAMFVLLELFEIPHLPTTTHTSQRHATITIYLSVPSNALVGLAAGHYSVVTLRKETRLVHICDKLQFDCCLRVLLFELVECCPVALVVSDHVRT
jgi:hypothetical protein